jgi:hypothetical protein
MGFLFFLRWGRSNSSNSASSSPPSQGIMTPSSSRPRPSLGLRSDSQEAAEITESSDPTAVMIPETRTGRPGSPSHQKAPADRADRARQTSSAASLEQDGASKPARARKTSPATNSAHGGDNLDMQSTLQEFGTAASHPADEKLSAKAAPSPTTRPHRNHPASRHGASGQTISQPESSRGQQRMSSSEVPLTRLERVQENHAVDGNVCSVCKQGSSQPDYKKKTQ